MHNFLSRFALAAVFFAPLGAFAAKPAVPTVTVGADLKQLQFDVEPVAGATFYQLWFLANGNASWVKYWDTTDADPLFKVTVSGHLLDWFNARYRVTACNAEGCSSTLKFAVTDHMKETPGYVKTRAAAVSPYALGQSPVLSADGKTLAVIGGETIGPRQHSIAVYVYQKTDAGWQYTSRLIPSLVEADTAQPTDQFQGTLRQLAISADGTTIVLGVPKEFVLQPNSYGDQGAAYVFRKSGTAWQLEQKISRPVGQTRLFGAIVDVDALGQTLAVWNWTGIGANAGGYWFVEVYRHGASGWTFIKQLPENSNSYEVNNFDLSGDGNVLALSHAGTIDVYDGLNLTFRQTLIRITEARRAVGLATNYDGSVIATATTPHPPAAGNAWQTHIMAFRRGSAGWVAEPAFTYLSKQANLQPGFSDEFAASLAVSTDGKFIAVGDPRNSYGGTGALHTPVTNTTVQNGAVFIFERKPSSWELRSLIKPNVSYEGTRFGGNLALGDNNRILAVGAIGDVSAARDIDGNQSDSSAPDSGALWLY